MIYNLNEKFTKIEEVKGVLENKCRHTSIELVTTDGVPEKDSGIELQPKEKMSFRLEKKQSLYARCTSLDGIMANLAVVNFNVPASDGSGAGVGSITYGHTVLDGYVKADGGLLQRDDYPDLFSYASENSLILPEADWTNNMQGMFAEGDGKSTFRIPDLRGEFLRGLDNDRGVDLNRALGSNQEGSQIPWHLGNTSSGASVITVQDGEDGVQRTQGNAQKMNSSVSGTYTDYRIRPRNIALIAQIKY